jgi:hypothetical protein
MVPKTENLSILDKKFINAFPIIPEAPTTRIFFFTIFFKYNND